MRLFQVPGVVARAVNGPSMWETMETWLNYRALKSEARRQVMLVLVVLTPLLAGSAVPSHPDGELDPNGDKTGANGESVEFRHGNADVRT